MKKVTLNKNIIFHYSRIREGIVGFDVKIGGVVFPEENEKCSHYLERLSDMGLVQLSSFPNKVMKEIENIVVHPQRE